MQSVNFGHSHTFPGNGRTFVRVQADGRVDANESRGVSRSADGFVGSLTDLSGLLRGDDVTGLGGRWEHIGTLGAWASYDNGDERVWRHGGSQQITVDRDANRVTLATLGSRGQHTLRAVFRAHTGAIVPRTIQEEFAPYDGRYEAMMRDGY